ncbi:MAG: hypothetical protein J6U54_12765 [Clostridiales bacterium]|nr:hypothetical protein [Clostridiales bacterium]
MSNASYYNKNHGGVQVYAEMLFRNGAFAKEFPDNYLDAYKQYIYGMLPSYAKKNYTEHHIFRFDNGYGASVIRGPFSYGGEKDLFEMAVIHFVEPEDTDEGQEYAFDLDEYNAISSDVLGWLSEEDVVKYLNEIKELPKYEANEDEEE